LIDWEEAPKAQREEKQPRQEEKPPKQEESQEEKPAEAKQEANRAVPTDCKSYYTVLQLGPNAPYKEVEKAFRTLSVTCHPDKMSTKTADADFQFTLLNTAKEVLRDATTRVKYDFECGFSRESLCPTGWAVRTSVTTGRTFYVRLKDLHSQWQDARLGYEKNATCRCTECAA